jgi:hypothetical protein
MNEMDQVSPDRRPTRGRDVNLPTYLVNDC